ncbi:MAG: dephospho-CoA kinase [Bacteroidota bacterium]
MLRIGLTGGIGSGKTTVGKIFSALGVPVYLADEAGKALLHTPAIRDQVAALLGKEVLDESGNIDRRRVAARVFADPKKLEQLNALIHPAVRRDFEDWAARQQSRYVIREAAILFESGSDADLDGVIAVSSPEHLRIKRVMQRDGVTEEEVRARMRHQWSDEEKIGRSQYVIVNDERELVIPQVLKLHQLFSEKQPPV